VELGLAGKVALVAGASRGMGLAAAAALAAEGASVVMVGRKQHRLDPAVESVCAAGGSAVGFVADLTAKAGVQEAVAHTREVFGPPDIAVTMGFAMVAERGFENLTDEQYRTGMDDAVMNIVHVAREVVPSMRERGWGRLLNIGSVAMKEPHREDPVLFSNIRVAACGLMKTLSNERTRAARHHRQRDRPWPGRHRVLREVRGDIARGDQHQAEVDRSRPCRTARSGRRHRSDGGLSRIRSSGLDHRSDDRRRRRIQPFDVLIVTTDDVRIV
jgi:NADP-dependent 3-hydroxy acid dehydrogenase YdfG